MTLERITPEEYGSLFPRSSHVFDSVGFNELNRGKCEAVHYLVFKDDKGKVRFGFILGERAEMFRAPFSAPFACMEPRGEQKLSFYMEAAFALREYGREFGKPVTVTLPPSCYDCGQAVAHQLLAMQSAGARVLFSDYNYHYPLDEFGDFRAKIWPNAKRNLASAERNGLEFCYIANPGPEEIRLVYEIVRINHESHGYPVHLSFDDVMATSEVVDMDFFVVRKDGEGVASAIIYHTSPSVVQLIYWGDLPDYRHLRPMNFMAYNIIRNYAESSADSGIKVFDLGPASSDGIPATGLCDFKESIGCHLTPKITLEL